MAGFQLFEKDLLTIKEASHWASEYLKKDVTPSNISYLVQYGRIKKYGDNGSLRISRRDLVEYYQSFNGKREIQWKNRLGDDLNWGLSFDQLKESERTKHVHRLHPYKGKFIPQLVEYFLDSHTDVFKKQVYFKPGDIVLDPFAGSGTTLIQANELGMHAIGIDISSFNSLIGNVKIGKHDFVEIYFETSRITKALRKFIADSNTPIFEKRLLDELVKFNEKYFPSPDFKHWVHEGKINEDKYGAEKAGKFLPFYNKLVAEYGILLSSNGKSNFLDKWYFKHVKSEIEFVYGLIDKIASTDVRNVLSIILSRTIRSCRATTHSDLATLKEPITATYYCVKHGKICKPLFSILSWWERYCQDTLERLEEFNNVRTATHQVCLSGDARGIDILESLKKTDKKFFDLAKKKKIAGIFSSPPYVGLIDYHEQHAYAYDLFGLERQDESEIGPLSKGQGRVARESYIQDIASVLNNCRRFLARDFVIFLVANDKYNFYPQIAEKTGLKIVEQYKRPVLNRTERDKSAYSETIFQLRRN